MQQIIVSYRYHIMNLMNKAMYQTIISKCRDHKTVRAMMMNVMMSKVKVMKLIMLSRASPY